jgi:hypothetical protein
MSKNTPTAFFDPLVPVLPPFEIGNLSIPRYGYITNAEARAEAVLVEALDKDADNVAYLSGLVAGILNLRLKTTIWTAEILLEQCPYNFMQAIYEFWQTEKKLPTQNPIVQIANLTQEVDRLKALLNTGTKSIGDSPEISPAQNASPGKTLGLAA